MNRPKVVHIITRLEPGGSSRNTVDSCAAQAADYDVTLISGPHPASGALRRLLPPSVRYIEVKDLQRELSAPRDFRALGELKALLAELRPDLVHTHTSKAGALGRLGAAMYIMGADRPEVALVHTPHGHLLYGYYGPLRTLAFKLAERFLAKLTDHFIALTPGEKRESVAAGIGREEQWEVIHSGVELAPPPRPLSKADLGLPENCVTAGTIARLEPVKGVEYLIRAAARIKDSVPALRTVIIGGGALEPGLRALAAELGVGDRVVFTGFREDAAAVLGALDIYVQPSLNEAMGRAPLEAQAMGLPAVVTEVCGLPDVIKPGETGLCVRAADTDSLAAAIKVLAITPELRARLGAAAKAWARSADAQGLPRFGTAAMTAALDRFYRRVLAARRKGPPQSA